MVFLTWRQRDTEHAQEISVVFCARRVSLSDQLPHRGDDVLNSEAEMLEQRARRSGLAEGIDADDSAVESHVFAPVVGHARFDRDARSAPWQHGVAVARVLAVERA